MKYLVPLARAKREDCEVLSEAIAKHHLTSREVGDLYGAWRDGSLDVRRRVLESPKLFLRAQRELEESTPWRSAPRMGCSATWSVAKAGAACGEEVAGRIGRDAAEEREEVRRCLEQALMDLSRLARRIGEEQTSAEPEHADDDPGAPPQGCGQADDCEDAGGLAGCDPEVIQSDTVTLPPSAEPERAEPFRRGDPASSSIRARAIWCGSTRSSGLGSEAVLPGADRLLPAGRHRRRSQAVPAGQLRLRARRGDAARHLAARGEVLGGQEAARADRLGGAVLLADALLPDATRASRASSARSS